MLLVYIAGPYTGENAWETEQNIQRAERAARDMMLECAPSVMAVCPHAMTRNIGRENKIHEDRFVFGTLKLSSQCDALFVVGDWEKSNGTKREIAYAQNQGKPVFFCIDDLRAWIRGQR